VSAHELSPSSPTPAVAPDATSTRIGLRLHAAMPWLVLPGGLPSQLALDGRLAPVPNVKPWLLGVMNLRGNLVPVFDVGLAMGYAALPRGAPVLVIAPGPTAMAVACCERPQLLEVGPAQAAPADDPMSALASCHFRSALGRVYEFDPRVWLRRIGAQVPGRHAG
jgi:twitching motility protein PilI